MPVEVVVLIVLLVVIMDVVCRIVGLLLYLVTMDVEEVGAILPACKH